MRGSWLPAAVLASTVALAGCGAGAAAPQRPTALVPTHAGTPASSAPVAPGTASSAAVSSPPAISTTASSSLRVTLADNGKTVTMHVGDTFLLALGTQQWTVHVGDQTVVARVPNIMVVLGAQGVYRALKVGSTTLSASGKPACPQGAPCPLYLLGFSVTLHVLARSTSGG